MTIMSVYTWTTVALVLVLLLPFYRILKGPTVFDRLLGASAIGTKTVVLVCLLGALYERLDMFIDIAIAYAILNFIGCIAVAKYYNTPRGQEQRRELQAPAAGEDA